MIRTEDEIKQILEEKRKKARNRILLLVRRIIDNKESDLDKELKVLGYDY